MDVVACVRMEEDLFVDAVKYFDEDGEDDMLALFGWFLLEEKKNVWLKRWIYKGFITKHIQNSSNIALLRAGNVKGPL